jgi:hypothetical protein
VTTPDFVRQFKSRQILYRDSGIVVCIGFSQMYPKPFRHLVFDE